MSKLDVRFSSRLKFDDDDEDEVISRKDRKAARKAARRDARNQKSCEEFTEA